MFLPLEPVGYDRFLRTRNRHAFFCGHQLGGCGGRLKPRRYKDRVCHFAHESSSRGRRCSRSRIGEDSADHLFIGKALRIWLTGSGIGHDAPEFLRRADGRAIAVQVRFGTLRDRLIHVQLVPISGEYWRRQRSEIAQRFIDPVLMVVESSLLAEIEIREAGRAVVLKCETNADARRVLIGIRRGKNPADWTTFDQYSLNPEDMTTRASTSTRPEPAPSETRRTTPKPAQIRALHSGRPLDGTSAKCSRFHADGGVCRRETTNPDGWCRSPDCGGFRTSFADPLQRGRPLHAPGEGNPRARLFPSDVDIAQVQVAANARNAFILKHHGDLKEAAVELHAMLRPFLDGGSHFQMPDGTWVLDRDGFRLILNERADIITGYDSMHAERSWAQAQAGVPSRLGQRARAERRFLLTPRSDAPMPEHVDPETVRGLAAEQFAVTALACIGYEKLNAATKALGDQRFIDDLYATLSADLESGKVIDDGGQLTLLGERTWWVLAATEPAVLGVHQAGTRALAPDPEHPSANDSDASPTVEMEPTSMEPAAKAPISRAEFDAMVGERIQKEREDFRHEALRFAMLAALQERARNEGGAANFGTYVDAWYESDSETVVFEVLEVGGYDYQDFRKAALDLMEVAYLHTAGQGATMVLVSEEPPHEEWVPNTLSNVFNVKAAWRSGQTWDGPGASHIVQN
ncbi:hypothetical protein O1R50_21225 [Glycomyces luteolus]|uniref:Uncharacterized protein n=1 Tax=Glycomyces luteolus TaxID=2670330 RepID=A0A9X3PEC1_9ACTN|nr:hypothetical protein [Glycomyces luteolus]MDA1362162.1 hypothetical protein [Glycomyces luteolus]